MTLQQLEYFLAALEHGSFTLAADSLLMAQPSLSDQDPGGSRPSWVSRCSRGSGEAWCRPRPRRRCGPMPKRRSPRSRPGAKRWIEQRELQGGIATFGTYGIARIFPGTELVAAFHKRYPKVRIKLVGKN